MGEHDQCRKLQQKLYKENKKLERRVKFLEDVVEEQKLTIQALNECIGGKDSTTLENIRLVDRLQCQIDSLTAANSSNPDCYMINKFSSTICSNGTNGCFVNHNGLPTLLDC